MKWETYKQLSSVEKEEWNFRFKDLTYPRIPLVYLVFIWMCLTVFMAIALVVLKEYVQVKSIVVDILSLQYRISSVMLVAFLVDYVGQLVYFIYKKYKEREFIKLCLKQKEMRK
jgi:hypothetical protein